MTSPDAIETRTMPARKPASRRFSRRRRAGFSLLEMSIVLAIMGALLSGGLLAGASMIERGQYSATRDALDQAAQALNDFSITTGRLPCVASLNALPNTTTFGTEIAAGGCTSGTPSGLATNGTWRAVDGTRIVRIGALPTRTLGLPDSAGADGFGNRILYVVTEGLTSTTAFTTTNGAIAVHDGSSATGNVIVNDGSPVGGAAFFLASAGADRKGGFGFKTGSDAIPCGTSTNLDVENCNLSSTDITFRDALFNDGTEAARRFDDLTRWATKYSLGVVTTGGGSSLWGNTGDTIFSVGNDNNTTTGNVGIGTTAPTTLLGVGPNPVAALGAQELLQLGRTSDAAMTAADGTARAIFGTASGLPYVGSQSNHDFTLRTNNTERMRITSTGNVGIGTNGPTSLLTLVANPTTDSGNDIAISSFSDVNLSPGFVTSRARGTSSAPTAIQLNDIASAFTGFGYNGSVYVQTGFITTIAEGAWTSTTTTNDSAMRFGTTLDGSPAERMRITSAGNVGIGYTNPSAMLDVNGSIASDQFTIPSDARLKHDIHPIFAGEGLKIIDGLTPVRFIWNKNDKPDIGLIAQEVEKRLPQAVEKNDNGFLRVTYDKIILPVITAIQDLHEIVKKLASQITAMAERQSALENRLTALEAENAALREEVKNLKMEKQN